MKILFKFASRSRPEKFLKGLDNISQFSDDHNHVVLCSLDSDDKTMKDFVSLSYNVLIKYGISKNKVDAINRDINEYNGDWDILVNMSDDMEFIKQGFDNIIRDDMNRYFPDLDGVLHYNDGNHYGNALMTMSIIGRKYYDRDKYIYHPDYISLWCDNEAMEVGIKRNKLQYIDNVLFNHNHPAWGKVPFDEQYTKTESFYRIDEATYNQRKERNFNL